VSRVDIVHFSSDPNFRPAGIESVSGYGDGLWVYPVRAAAEAWTDRRPFYGSIDRKYLVEIQRFRKGELNGSRGQPEPPHLIIEMMVPAKWLSKIQWW